MGLTDTFDRWLEGTVDRDTQVDQNGIHLTIAEVTSLHHMGKLDFGGSEMTQAAGHAIEPVEHALGDSFGWWRLDEGNYVVRFNEKVKQGAPCMLLITSPRALACGCRVATTMVCPGEIRSVLSVPKCGVRIKQNARIAMLLG